MQRLLMGPHIGVVFAGSQGSSDGTCRLLNCLFVNQGVLPPTGSMNSTQDSLCAVAYRRAHVRVILQCSAPPSRRAGFQAGPGGLCPHSCQPGPSGTGASQASIPRVGRTHGSCCFVLFCCATSPISLASLSRRVQNRHRSARDSEARLVPYAPCCPQVGAWVHCPLRVRLAKVLGPPSYPPVGWSSRPLRTDKAPWRRGQSSLAFDFRHCQLGNAPSCNRAAGAPQWNDDLQSR